MLAVEGTFQEGVVCPDKPIAGRNGQKVMIVFLQKGNEPPIEDSAWGDFAQLLNDCQVHTGIDDLAHQHDHYLYGTSKHKDEV